MICKNCNREIPNDSEYCSFCGNVIQSVVSTSASSDLSKGYTYLELKQWKDAEQFFRDAIINGDNKSEAYIGKMLSKHKTDSIEKLVSSGKKFSGDDDFKLALKYAAQEYADYLKEFTIKVEKKHKKRTIIISSICACVMAIALLSYFVFIPLNKISDYENLLADGKIQKAVKSYTNSKWFEYDQKAKDLFYEKGLKLVEAKDYKNAEICFDVVGNRTAKINDLFYKSGLELIKTKDYKNAEICFEIIKNYNDSEKYLNYCKAQSLLANNDLESYNYFTDLGDFLDSKEILNTNKYFVMVNKLQGDWEHPELKPYKNRDTSNINHSSNDEIFYATNSLTILGERISIKGITVSGEYTKGKLMILNDKISLYDKQYERNYNIDCVSDTVIQIEDDMIDNIEWTKVK